MGKYLVSRIVLDTEALESDIKAELDALVSRYAEDSGESESAIRTRMRGILVTQE